MGKKARTRRAEKRKSEKRARKERQKALYASFKQEGKNKKSKRVALNSKRVGSVRTKRHAFGSCGNLGCKKCSKIVIASHSVSQASKPYHTAKEWLLHRQAKRSCIQG